MAVIASLADLRRAMLLRRLPDFFELRLDGLHEIAEQVLGVAAKLRVPLIISARHPAEGGLNRLGLAERRRRLMKFLPVASFVDVEVRSVASLSSVLAAARDLRVRCILSVHDLQGTPTPAELKRLAGVASQNGADIFKLVTRTDTAEQEARLVAFFLMNKARIAISAMSVGKHGRELRLFFARHGSQLNYAHLGTAQAEGQWAWPALRRALKSQT